MRAAPVWAVTFKIAGRWRNSSGGKSCRRTSLTKLNDLATTPGSSLNSRLHGTVDQTWPTLLHMHTLHTIHTPLKRSTPVLVWGSPVCDCKDMLVTLGKDQP